MSQKKEGSDFLSFCPESSEIVLMAGLLACFGLGGLLTPTRCQDNGRRAKTN
jgi:hypothetical protein